jgi:hypothetical protein
MACNILHLLFYKQTRLIITVVVPLEQTTVLLHSLPSNRNMMICTEIDQVVYNIHSDTVEG